MPPEVTNGRGMSFRFAAIGAICFFMIIAMMEVIMHLYVRLSTTGIIALVTSTSSHQRRQLTRVGGQLCSARRRDSSRLMHYS